MGETEMSRGRWPAVGLLLGLGLVLVGGWVWVPWADSPARLTPVPAASLFTPGQIAHAEQYASSVRAAGLLSLAVSLAVLVLLAALPGPRRAIGALSRRLPWWLVVPVAVVAVRVAVSTATLPLGLWIRQLTLANGLSTQGLAGWLTDRALGEATTVVVDTVVLGVLIGCARVLPRAWPVAAGSVLAGLVFAGSFVYPVVVEPLFNHFTPLPDGPLRQQILELAAEEQVSVDDVLVADASRRTTTLNAYVSGFGSTRRVVVYDTLLEPGVPTSQVQVVVAHELAHARHQDVLKGTALGAGGTFAGVCLLGLVAGGLTSRRSVRGEGVTWVPALLALVAVASLAVAPAVNAASRAVELRADSDALRATGDRAAFVALQRRLALRSLADPTPPWLLHWWFGTHPTVLERVALAERSALGVWPAGKPSSGADERRRAKP